MHLNKPSNLIPTDEGRTSVVPLIWPDLLRCNNLQNPPIKNTPNYTSSTCNLKQGPRRPTDNPSTHEELPAVVDVTSTQPVSDDGPRAKCNFHAENSHKINNDGTQRRPLNSRLDRQRALARGCLSERFGQVGNAQISRNSCLT